MRPVNLKYIYYIAPILLVAAVIKFTQADKNEKLLNIFARAYFDQEYYLANYPEVKAQPITPFEHYVSLGWKEGKNPNGNFNTKFYISNAKPRV